MTAYVALLRAINVGGTGRLAMRDLVTMCERAGFEQVRTYIQSGNVVFTSRLAEDAVRAALERPLATRMGKSVRVLVRSATGLEAIAKRAPWPAASPDRVVVVFLDRAPRREAIAGIRSPGGEEVVLHGREVYVHYPDGQGRSRLKLPFAEDGTGRNLNTVNRLVAMVRALDGRGW